ncbi:MAG: hypothetical protein Q4B01_02740 [Eubacteriales bacterium]|nr:hypothetical protein [Eubacteriales bacterium]
MRKKMIALVMTGLCTAMLCPVVQAASVDELASVVISALENKGITYDYDKENEWIDMKWTIDGDLEETDVTIFLYDDMVSVAAESPVGFKEDQFEKMAIYTTLLNNEIFYGEFRLNKDRGKITVRSSNVIENVLPGEAEIDTLLMMPIRYLEKYGDGITAIRYNDADPYETFEKVMNAQ